jgi:predicted ribonuclease YlaK
MYQMTDLSPKLKGIREKLDKLIQMQQGLGLENKQLRAQNELLKNNLEAQRKELDNQTEKNKIIKLAKSLSEAETDNHDIKLKVNELIREVDKCISLLNC